MGNNNHVVSHRLCGFQRCLNRRVVVMKEPVVVTPKFRSFSSHIFSQASQNITVKVRVYHSARRNKFTVNNSLHIEKNNEHALCWTSHLPRLFFSWWLWAIPLQQLLLCFWIITANPTFVTCYDLEVKGGSSLAFSCNSRHTFTHCCFWSFVKSQQRNFAAMWRTFKFSVKISWQTA
jgi:hypothetical protein